AWVAIEGGAVSIAQNTITGSAARTTKEVTEQDFPIDFGTTYAQAPVFLADIQTFSGNNPASIRYKNLSQDKVVINLQEETSGDAEVRHPAKERIGYVVFESEGFISGNPIENPQNRETDLESLDGPSFRINCYPNPFVQNFTIDPIDHQAQRLMIEVTDIQGRMVFQR
ncbi:MAG: hypothetical protein AAGM67_22255, partial [Bacteroidota bacterium]